MDSRRTSVPWPHRQRRGAGMRPDPSPAGNRCPRRLVRSPHYAFVGAGLGPRSRDLTRDVSRDCPGSFAPDREEPRFAQTHGRLSRWPPMTEDGKPLETLLEDAARARRLAIVLDGDPARSSLSNTPKKWRPRSTGVLRGRIKQNSGAGSSQHRDLGSLRFAQRLEFAFTLRPCPLSPTRRLRYSRNPVLFARTKYIPRPRGYDPLAQTPVSRRMSLSKSIAVCR